MNIDRGPKPVTWTQKAVDLGIWLDLWRHWANCLKYIWYWSFAPLFLTSPIPRGQKIPRPSFLGNPGCDSPLKSVNISAGLSSCSKLLACFMPSLVPGFTQECLGWGDFIRTINNGGDMLDLHHYYPDCKTTCSRAWTLKESRQTVLSTTVLPVLRLRMVFGEPSQKSMDLQQVWWVFCRAADVLWVLVIAPRLITAGKPA